MSKKWYRLHNPEPLDGATNMAVDQYLLERVEAGVIDRPILRIYRWDKPTLSLGYHQQWERTVKPEVPHRTDVGLVRRWTGGRAVLHQHEITYAVVAPMSEPFSRRITHNYQLIGDALHRFTTLLGSASAQLAAEPEQAVERAVKMRHAPCFASLSQAEVESGGRKMIGSAQKLGQKGFLQHGSIPLEDHSDLLRELTGTELDMSRYMTSLGDQIRAEGGSLPEADKLAETLTQAFAEIFSADFEDLAEPDPTQIETIAANRFRNPDWTFRK